MDNFPWDVGNRARMARRPPNQIRPTLDCYDPLRSNVIGLVRRLWCIKGADERHRRISGIEGKKQSAVLQRNDNAATIHRSLHPPHIRPVGLSQPMTAGMRMIVYGMSLFS